MICYVDKKKKILKIIEKSKNSTNFKKNLILIKKNYLNSNFSEIRNKYLACSAIFQKS